MYVVYAQRNVPGGQQVPWANQRLGTVNGVTIGSDGCYVTAMAQVATHYEHVINPAQLDDIMTARGLYAAPDPRFPAAKDLMYDVNLSRVFPDIQFEGTSSWANAADLNSLVMSDDREIIIGLDTHNLGRNSDHFARVNDYNPKTGVLLIDDPWWGRTLNFATLYGAPARNVMKAARYRIPGWVPPWKRVAPPVLPPVVVPVVDPKDAIIAALQASQTLQAAQLRATMQERDALRMAWNHLDATFAEVRLSITK